MKKNIFLIIIFFLLAYLCFLPKKDVSASKDNQTNIILKDLQDKIGPDFQYSLDQNTGKFTFISGKDSGIPLGLSKSFKNDPKSVANEFMNQYGIYFGIKDSRKELFLIRENEDELKMKHIRYNQKYNDVPVFGAQTIVHLKEDLSVKSANGKAVPDISIDSNPKLSKGEAESKAREYWKNQFDLDSAEVKNSDLYIFNKGLVENKKDDNNYLVWRVDLYNQSPRKHEFYFINAQNGDLVYQITGIQKAIDRRIYDCSLYPLFGYCYLDYSYGEYTYGRSEGQSSRGTNPLVGGTDVDDLYAETNNCHNYYFDKFSIDGANSLGGIGDGASSPFAKTDGFTHLDYVSGQECPNAYWDGYSVNFCQNLVLTDVVAHEYGHGLVSFTADLTYSYESGAMNESYADILGEAVEYDSSGSSDWLIGEDVNTGGLVGPLRNMQNPSSLSDSIGAYPNKFYDSNFYCGTSDYGGVHHNSSVSNHAAYLMAMGGTYNGCTISGIGRDKEEKIFYRALNEYLTSSSGFNEAYDALVASCNDLYGSGSADCLNATRALQSVEMDQGGQCSAQLEADPECATTVATPTANPDGGTYSSAQTVTLSTTTSEASIYYTTDGTTPTTSSTLYTSAITVSTSQTIKAIATKSVMINSAVMSETYVIDSSSNPVYRFFNKIKGNHFYTQNEGEKDNIIATLSDTWNYEGIAYSAYSTQAANTSPLYRFWNKNTGFHFYTQNEGEKDNIIATLSDTWNYEGIAYYTYSTSQPNTTAVYRFFNKIQGNHFYTTSVTEKDNIIATLSATWNYEGIAWYANS